MCKPVFSPRALRRVLFVVLGVALAHGTSHAAAIDTIVFGDASSEQAHVFDGEATKVVAGALGEPARVSLPKEPVDYYGGDLTFEMKVDPVAQNYLTVKFWGSDVNGGQKAILYIEGEQLGYRHMGDYEALNHGTGEPSFRERFFYYTDVLPLHVTRGRQSITLSIRTIGPISGYQLGGGYDGYQKKMTAPSRGYYRAYTHATPALTGLEAEKQGAAPQAVPVRAPRNPEQTGGNERNRARQLADKLKDPGGSAPGDISSLAHLLHDAWATADEATREETLTLLVSKIDACSANAYNPTYYAKGVYQGDWGGSFQRVAEGVIEMGTFVSPEQWKSLLDERITVKDEAQTRRTAWTRMLKGNFDYARTHIARITNQAMFCLHGAYRSNRALLIVNPEVAEPEETAKRFIFEAAGIWPYHGNDVLDESGKLVGHEDPYGPHYLQITEAGLTRESTYVAIYGEVANELVDYWEAYGYDELLKKALVSSNARSYMKYQDFDDNGFRVMRMEGVIESRGPAYPDNVGYGVRFAGLKLARIKRLMEQNPEKYKGPEWEPYWKMATDAVAYAQQSLNDNQYEGGRGEDYDYVKNHPQVGTVLPMTYLGWYTPDELSKLKAAGLDEASYQRRSFVDIDNGVVAVRDGDTVLFAGLVMKANWGVNGIARIHCMTPAFDRLSTVVPDAQFEWDGRYSRRPDWTNVQFMEARSSSPPEGPFQVMADEVLPFATQPTVQLKNPVDTPYAGYANFYSLQYLDLLIGMNTTRAQYGNARPYTLKMPKDYTAATVLDLVSNKELPVTDGAVEVGPQVAVVLKVPNTGARVPATPRLVVASADEKRTTVRWQHAAGATGYVIKRNGSARGQWGEAGRVDGNTNTFVDTAAGLKDGDFRYTVAGTNDVGVGGDGPMARVAPVAPEVVAWLDRKPGDPNAGPEAPRDLVGENVKRRVDLKWKVARRGVAYDVLRSESADGPFRPVATALTKTYFRDENLEYGKKYAYTVVATNRGGARGTQAPPVSFAPVDDTIPGPWKGDDVGAVGVEGADGLIDGVFSVRGAGADLWGGKDAFRFVHQPLAGDGTIVARVAELQNTSEWAKCGLMIRASLDEGAPNAFAFTTPGHGIILQSRTNPGGGTNGTALIGSFGKSPWLKIARRGNTFTAWASADGNAWTEIGAADVAMPANVYVGLVVSSHAASAINLTRFDHVNVTKP